MLTVEEIKERILHTYDADMILELLDISAEELLDQFDYKIDDDIYEKLNEEFEYD